jgi:hypothetical protein
MARHWLAGEIGFVFSAIVLCFQQLNGFDEKFWILGPVGRRSVPADHCTSIGLRPSEAEDV